MTGSINQFKNRTVNEYKTFLYYLITVLTLHVCKDGDIKKLLGIKSVFKIIQLDLLFLGRIPSFTYTTIYELTMQSVVVDGTYVYPILELNKTCFYFKFSDFPVQKFIIHYGYDAFYVVFIVYILVYLIERTFPTLLNEMWTTQIEQL